MPNPDASSRESREPSQLRPPRRLYKAWHDPRKVAINGVDPENPLGSLKEHTERLARSANPRPLAATHGLKVVLVALKMIPP